MIYEFDGFRPVVAESAFVHPLAAVIGNVTIGRDVYVGPGAALRGDWGAIEIGDGSNIQENCVIHAFPGVTVVLEEAAHLGHGAIVHGARIGRNALVGMNAVIMDHARIGPGAIVGALSFVKEGMEVPERMIVAGNPARLIKPVSDEMLAWKTEGTRLYQSLPAILHATLRECEPLRVPPSRPPDPSAPRPLYDTWQERKSRNG
jgi:phenylacetic acid degradation protein